MNILSEIPASIAKDLPIKSAILQAGIAFKAPELCKDLGKLAIICDQNTENFVNLAGEKIVLPGLQKAELAKASELSKTSCDHFIAIGSGTLNDIVKYAAHLAGKPYTIFATAPSMNGYASANASLLDGGYKKSFPATAPQNIYLDLEILKNAPRRLINSGIGDSICRSTAEADAILSAQIKNTPDYADLFSLLRTYEEQIFDDITALTKTLIFGGIAMLVAKSSAPASGGEHMLAHYMELMQPDAPVSFHGEQIAVTTLTMAALQEKLLCTSFEIPPIDEAKLHEHFGAEFAAYCLAETNAKYSGLTGRKIAIDKDAIEKSMLTAEYIRQQLQKTGAKLTAEEIGWDKEIYAGAIEYARYTRNRFTFLDLL